MPSYNCKHGTCNVILPVKGYCPAHQHMATAPQAEYDRYQRDQWSKKFYASAQWIKTRLRKLSRNPMCEEPGCRSLAEHVHHKRPVKDIRFTEPRLLYADENLESVCAPCHNRIEKTLSAQPS